MAKQKAQTIDQGWQGDGETPSEETGIAVLEPIEQLVTVGPAFGLSERSLTVASDTAPTFLQAERAVNALARVKDSLDYWLGDMFNLVETLFAEEASQLIDASLFDLKDVKERRYVAERVPADNRALAASFAHSKAVAALAPSHQAKWLQLALDDDWSAAKLKSAVEAAGSNGESAIRYMLVVDCKTEEGQAKIQKELEAEGLSVTVRTSVKKARKVKAAVTAKSKGPRAYKRRVPK